MRIRCLVVVAIVSPHMNDSGIEGYGVKTALYPVSDDPYPMTLVTTPAPTVRPPSRIANRDPSSNATGTISFTPLAPFPPPTSPSHPSAEYKTEADTPAQTAYASPPPPSTTHTPPPETPYAA